MTQEDLLAEAKITEELNMESLKVMLKNFEEKKKQTVKKQKAPGPHTTFHSYTVTDPETGERFCKNEISFSDPSVIPTNLCPSTGISPHQKEPFLCAVPACGKPAKYRDPLTGKGYHSVECFRAIRAMHLRNEEKSYTKRIAMLQNLLSNKMKKKAELLARNPALSVATSSTSLSTAPPLSQQQQQQQQPTPSNPLTNSTPITSSTTLVVTTNAPAQAPAQANTQTTMTTAPPAVLGAPLLYPCSPSVFAPPRL
ncbi:hypothetical protein Pelo_8336 [Pelomyxa schiedti]|nr:hypothetical protein Pelo_8336 [Pelomyxa schiedti]